jgi:predicted Zn-dependent protease
MASVHVVATNLDGIGREVPESATRGEELYAHLRSMDGTVGEAECVDLVRALITPLPSWFADSGYEARAYVSWHDSTHGWFEDGELKVARRQYSRVSFLAHDPVANVTGKSGVCLADGLAYTDEAALRTAFEGAIAQAKRLASGQPLPDNVGSLVLGPVAAGTFLHEVIGHLCEADNVAGSGGPRLGRQLSRAPITAIDGLHRPGDWGATEVDDEGVATQLTTLVDSGTVAGHLQDRRTAGAEPSNGHGLRATFRDQAYPRLTQIGFAPGDAAPEELVASVRSGVYIETFGYGYLNPRTAQARLIIREGRLISDGILTDSVVNGGEFQLDAYRALDAVTGVGRDLTWHPALCLKRRQELPVLNGGVTLLLDRPASQPRA